MIVKCQCCKERECTNSSLVAEEVSTSFEIKNYVKETTIIPKIQIYIQNNPYYYEDFCEENLKEGYCRKKESLYSVDSGSKTDSLERYSSNNDVSKYLEPQSGLKRWASVFSFKSIKSTKSSSNSNKLEIEDIDSFKTCRRNQIRRNAVCNPFHIPLTDELKQNLKLNFNEQSSIQKTNYSYLVAKYLRFLKPNKVGIRIHEY